MSTAIKNKNILISGASIAGPALAYWLTKYGYSVTIVEKAPSLREGGYRVDIRGAAVRAVERMGLMSKILANGTAMKGSSMVNRKGKTLLSFDDPNLFGMRQDSDMEIMRGDLSQILYDVTKSDVEYIFNDSILKIYETAESVDVIFKNGPARTFDLVIGADGLHSNVRSQVFGNENIFISNLGYYISIFTIPNYFGLDQRELVYQLPGGVVNVYSVGKSNEAMAMFMFAAENISYNYRNIEQQKQIVTNHFKNAGWEIPKILDSMADATDFYFDSISQVHMNKLSKSRVALLGDAAYCPSPASGQGTSLALVGAYVLAGELAAAKGDHEAAFAKYESEMKPFIRKNQQLGISVLEEMIPKSKSQIWFQHTVMRLLFKLPQKEKIFKGMLKKTQTLVNEAANGIELKDYDIEPVLEKGANKIVAVGKAPSKSPPVGETLTSFFL